MRWSNALSLAVGTLAVALTMGGLVAAEGNTSTGPLCTESAACICPEDERVCVPGTPVAATPEVLTPEPIVPVAVEPVLPGGIYVIELPSTGTGGR